jgi:dTDP-N-acetylfucosamine:lipid II N-acetylfucosaminyltransferase
MKILHLSTDEQFVDHAFPVFESVYPGGNEVFIFSINKFLTNTNLKPDYIESSRKYRISSKAKLGEDIYSRYDLIVFHSLNSSIYPELANIPDDTPTLWLGWGFDYYDDFLNHNSLLLKKTQCLYKNIELTGPKRFANNLLKKLMNHLLYKRRKLRAIERLTVFSPVLPKEYEMVRKSHNWRQFPKYGAWNYGTIEDNFINGFKNQTVSGDCILVGNSATYTGNHLEAFDLLVNIRDNDRKVVVPLSYGEPPLAKKLVLVGEGLFSDNFEPLTDFMPIQDYVNIIRKCGFVIMNHIRQQAIGNIVIMLYLGARVFLRMENPAYDFFKKMGVVISTVQELEAQQELLDIPLTTDERTKNRELVSEYWSRDKSISRTKKLIEFATREEEDIILSN